MQKAPPQKRQRLITNNDENESDDLDGGDGMVTKLTLANLTELYAPDIPIIEKWLQTSSGCKGIPSLAYLSALSWAASKQNRNST